MEPAVSVIQPARACAEHELVAAVRSGSDRAFEELYSRYRARICSYVLGMVGDHSRAEDIAQEVFISALRRLRETDRPIAFKPWLYEIAKNACIDEFRRSRRMREIPLEADEEDAGGPTLAGGTTPDAAIERKQRLDDLRGAFHGLSENHRRMLVMRELEGRSYIQIGAALRMTTPMVESNLFRARRKLGEEYEELVSGRRCERVQCAIEADAERPLRSRGLRERRQLVRHLAHCQPCRRYARMNGVDDSFFQTPGLIGKIAALLPFPWLRWRRSPSDAEQAAGAGSHQLAAVPVVARLADPSMPMLGSGRAAAAAATLVIAGVGGGLVAGLGPGTHAGSRHGGGVRSASPHGPGGSGSRVSGAGTGRASAEAAAGRVSGAGGGGSSVPRRGSSALGPSGGQGGGGPSGGGGGGHSGGGGGGGGPSGVGGGGRTGGAPSGGGSGSPPPGTIGNIGSTLHKVTAGGSNTVSQVTSGAANTLKQVGSGASSTVGQLTSGAANTLKQVGSGASSTVGQLTSGASSTVNNVASGATGTVNQATSGAANAVNQVGSSASNAVGQVTSGASSTVGNVASGATGTVSKTPSRVGQLASGASTTANHATSGAANALGSLTKP